MQQGYTNINIGIGISADMAILVVSEIGENN